MMDDGALLLAAEGKAEPWQRMLGTEGGQQPPTPALMTLPEELRLRVLDYCSPRGLLRAAATCVTLRDLLLSERPDSSGERLWRQLLHEVWLRNPRCSQYGGQQPWWLCRVVAAAGSSSGDPAAGVHLALPWRVRGSSSWCQLLRPLSFRESYRACVMERERSHITSEELVALRWSADFSGMAACLPLADNLRSTDPIALPGAAGGREGEDGGGVPSCFHRDGCYEDSVLYSRGSRQCTWVHSGAHLGQQQEQQHHVEDTVALFPRAVEGSRHLRVQRTLLDSTSWTQMTAQDTREGSDLTHIAAQLQQSSYTWSLTEIPSGLMTLTSNRCHHERVPCWVVGTSNEPTLAGSSLDGCPCTIERYDAQRGKYRVRVEIRGASPARGRLGPGVSVRTALHHHSTPPRPAQRLSNRCECAVIRCAGHVGQRECSIQRRQGGLAQAMQRPVASHDGGDRGFGWRSQARQQ
jgi:hypothetical protein